MNFKIFTAAALISILLAFAGDLRSQGIDGDPMSRVHDLINSDEIVLINSQTLGSDPLNQTVKGRIFDYDYNQTSVDNRLVPMATQNDSIITNNKRMDVASGNFLGGRFKHMIAAWTGSGNSIRLSVPVIVAGTLTWPSANRLTIPNATITLPNSKVRIITGNFYGDSKDEAVVSYLAPDSTIMLKLINISSSLVPSEGNSINN
ncbi:MAG: hypothetical protein ABI462_11905, partial [Ignavibacteria bacterium]